MAYTNRFEEWTTCDAKGNTVHCYANNLREIHVKVPVCICGRNMTEDVPGYWVCRPCDITKTDDEIERVMDASDYESERMELECDYGDIRYEDRRLVLGSPNAYDFYASR